MVIWFQSYLSGVEECVEMYNDSFQDVSLYMLHQLDIIAGFTQEVPSWDPYYFYLI